MNYELTGKLIEKYDAVQLTEKFRKREFVVEVFEKRNENMSFTEYIKFQLTNDRCGLLDFIPVNTEVKVTFNVKGRRYEKDGKVGYFSTLEAWRIEAATNQVAAPA